MINYWKRAKEIGEEGEKEFRRWMNSHSIIFYPIDQRMGLLPNAVAGEKIRRPDYILWVKQTGFILVDVKFYSFLYKHDVKGFNIHVNEVDSYLKFQEDFTSKIWFAVSNKEISEKYWYWISAKTVAELIKNSESHSKDFFVPLDKFREIAFEHDLSQVIL